MDDIHLEIQVAHTKGLWVWSDITILIINKSVISSSFKNASEL